MSIKIANKSYIINNNGLYECSECHSIFGKVWNLHNDNTYSLQCPVNREHCYIANKLDGVDLSQYKTIPNIKSCPTCKCVLVYTKEHKLICPNNINHVQPCKVTDSEIEKLGYLPKC